MAVHVLITGTAVSAGAVTAAGVSVTCPTGAILGTVAAAAATTVAAAAAAARSARGAAATCAAASAAIIFCELVVITVGFHAAETLAGLQ